MQQGLDLVGGKADQQNLLLCRLDQIEKDLFCLSGIRQDMGEARPDKRLFRSCF